MTAISWDRIKPLLVRCSSLSPNEREELLRVECGSDPELHTAVLDYLNAMDGDPDFLEDSSRLGTVRVGPRDFEILNHGAAALPERVGAYRILEQIGEGGLGTVYLGEQTEPVRRQVAIKLVRTGRDSREVLVRFEHEHQALSLMNHPAIARVYEPGVTDDGRPFFVMEYVPGVPITEYCDREALTTAERLSLFISVCHAVQHAHQKSVIHRDLKPSNILVTDLEGRPQPKVIDFGIAKATEQHLKEEALTSLGQMLGTPEYMPPEQTMASMDIDTRADVYALGVLLYELLVGSLPFEPAELRAAGHAEMQRIIREVEPERPSARLSSLQQASGSSRQREAEARTLISQLRGDLDWITMKAIEKDRGRRYPSASELASDIDRYLKHEPVMARPPSAVYRVKKLVRRFRGPVTAGALVLVTLIVGLTWSLIERGRAERERDRVLRLSDIYRLDDLRTEADDLWPAGPEGAEALVDWLRRARALHEHLEQHEADLVRLELRGERDGAGTEMKFAREEDAWQHGILTELVAALNAFGEESGEIADVEKRLVFARAVRDHTLDSPEAQAAWARAVESIADPTECPLYEGLVVEPQLGLLPLGRDPRSGLWEFWHVQTGARPLRPPGQDPLVGWIMGDDTGLVLVLVPGGTLTLGAERPDLGARLKVALGGLEVQEITGSLAKSAGLAPGDLVRSINGLGLSSLGDLSEVNFTLELNSLARFEIERGGEKLLLTARVEHGVGLESVDPRARPDESPLHDVELGPFFISKYEMTRGQWMRLFKKDPSYYKLGLDYGDVKIIGLTHPVENMPWADASRRMEQISLGLPTEAQWEWSCRALTGSVFYPGNAAVDLQGFANLRDRTSVAQFPAQSADLELDDGFVGPAPIGTFLPNRFGLHDVHGNVWEWCRDSEVSYDRPCRPGDGLRSADPELPNRVRRGGSWAVRSFEARAANRARLRTHADSGNTGIRPSRGVSEGL